MLSRCANALRQLVKTEKGPSHRPPSPSRLPNQFATSTVFTVKSARAEVRMSRVWIGTSGWTYDGWRGPFYPEDVAKKNWLRFYGTQFPSTEVNGSFYRTPSLEAVRAWHDQ